MQTFPTKEKGNFNVILHQFRKSKSAQVFKNGKAFDHGLHQNWAHAQLYLPWLLVPLKLAASSFTYHLNFFDGLERFFIQIVILQVQKQPIQVYPTEPLPQRNLFGRRGSTYHMLYLTFLGKVLFVNMGWKQFCCTDWVHRRWLTRQRGIKGNRIMRIQRTSEEHNHEEDQASPMH